MTGLSGRWFSNRRRRSASSASEPTTCAKLCRKAGGDLEQIQKKIDDEIERAVEKAKTAPKPVLADLLTDVYAS